VSGARTDLTTGLLGLTLSGAYLWVARGIEDSLLADEVGAAGVPTGVGLLLGLAATLLLLKGLVRWRAESRAQRSPAGEEGGSDAPAHRAAAGLLLILLAYALLLSVLGYVLSLSLMVLAVAWYAGGRERLTLLGLAVVTGPLLWLMFDFLLQVRMPRGLWSIWLGA